MSSTQSTASPRPPRHNRPPKPATQSPNNPGTQSRRRQKGNRTQSATHVNTRNDGADAQTHPAPIALEPPFVDGAAHSGEEAAIPTGPRKQRKKHDHSQPVAERVSSPRNIASSSLTDTELPPAVGTPAKVQGAYAGPTFHASPAPSALPVPKFLSKSVPAKTRAAPPTPPPEDDSDSGSSLTPSPSRAPIPVPARQQDSPLDLLFKAHRAEKARATNGSPASASFTSPYQPSTNGRPPHVKQDSFGSLNSPFPFELDGDNRASHVSPPPASPGDHRSSTAPGKIPQVSGAGSHNNESGAIHDLLNRLSMSQTQNKATSFTPPRTADHMSDSAQRNHTPPFNDGKSPFMRSSSGPSTPSAAPQQNPDFFYGNRNLSPMFNAVKTDTSKRNSGLRTEVTANSPLMPQGSFPQAPQANVDTRALLGNLFNGPASPRRGSAPLIPPMQQMMPAPLHFGAPNDQHQQTRSPQARSPGRRPVRPGSYHARQNGNSYQASHGTPPATSQKSSTAMSFVPSSVRAKPQAPTPKKAEPDTATLEDNLKRMLNVHSGNATGI